MHLRIDRPHDISRVPETSKPLIAAHSAM
jgi:hypothetical protein